MRQRHLNNQADLDRAAADLVKLVDHLPLVMSLTEGSRIRSNSQNKRHWVNIREFLNFINDTIDRVSEHTGYTHLEVRRLIAQELQPEQMGIVFATKSDTVHDILKMICGIPTSTRLGTKAFSKFDEVLEGQIADIIGTIRAVAMKSGA